MATAEQPLGELLTELQQWLNTLESAASAPSWTSVLIAEETNVDRSRAKETPPTLRRDDLSTPAAFERRWSEIVDLGMTDWINLSAQGVWDDALVVFVEPPIRGEPHSHSPERISVNFSGPRSWSLETHLAIV
jgi:hypothetical protein